MNISLDDLAASPDFGGNRGRREQITWLPEPAPRQREYTVISVDDHVVEPPDTFAGRFPKRFASEEPRVVTTDDGGEAWTWQGQLLPNVGFNAVVGRPSSEYGFEPTRFDEMRSGAYDVTARVADMDIDGVYASLCFPSFLPGFVGQRLTLWPDSDDLALVAIRAYNDWHLEAWCGAYPDRFVPNQIAYLRDPEVAAAEIRRNAERGFKAVTFSEADYGCEQILPVDYAAITRGGSAATNYQVMPGDRVFIADDNVVGFNNVLGKFTAPIERLLGIAGLGSSTVRGYQTLGRGYNQQRQGF